MKKKILVIGNSANSYSLVKKISNDNDVFVAPGADLMNEFATCIDIREDDTKELLEFAVENGIDLTIPISSKALQAGIVDTFTNNAQPIFGPTKNAFNLIFNKTLMKKVLYKLRIPTPRFGIFEKINLSLEYLKNIKQPFVIKTNESSSAVILNSQKVAKNVLESCFAQSNQKVLIEDYIWGTPFSFYAITDGYKALPIGSSIIYRHSLEGDGGQLTSGMGSCVPNYKLSNEKEYFLMDNVVYPILEFLEYEKNPYIGILGIDAILTEDNNIQIIGLKSFMQDCDCSAILELLDVNILELLNSCIIGSFSDEIDYISQKDLSATTLVLVCKNKENDSNSIIGLENLDEDSILTFYPQIKKNKYLEYEAKTGSVLTLTTLARTISSSTQKVYNEVENINFKGLYYRKDICKALSADI